MKFTLTPACMSAAVTGLALAPKTAPAVNSVHVSLNVPFKVGLKDCETSNSTLPITAKPPFKYICPRSNVVAFKSLIDPLKYPLDAATDTVASPPVPTLTPPVLKKLIYPQSFAPMPFSVADGCP